MNTGHSLEEIRSLIAPLAYTSNDDETHAAKTWLLVHDIARKEHPTNASAYHQLKIASCDLIIMHSPIDRLTAPSPDALHIYQYDNRIALAEYLSIAALSAQYQCDNGIEALSKLCTMLRVMQYHPRWYYLRLLEKPLHHIDSKHVIRINRLLDNNNDDALKTYNFYVSRLLDSVDLAIDSLHTSI